MLRRLLRNIGFALILLPEPFTTPLGLALLGAAYVFSRSRRIDSPRQLRGLIRLYFDRARPVGQTGKIIQHKLKQKLIDYEWRGSQPMVPEKDIRSNIEISRLILRYGETMNRPTEVYHSLEQRWANYDWPGQPRSIGVAEKTVYHTMVSGFVAGRDDDRRSTLPVDKVIYHNLKQGLAGYVLPSESLVPEKIIRHILSGQKSR